jgi:hypothetical protein
VKRRYPTITELFDLGTPIDRALRAGVRDALRRHKQLGQRVAVWQDGRVIILEPDQIPVNLPRGTGTRRQSRSGRRER